MRLLLLIALLALAAPARAEVLEVPVPGDLRYAVLSFPAGSLQDPPGKEGLARVVATVIESQVEKRLQEGVGGAEVFTTVDRERVTFWFKAHEDVFDAAFAVLQEELTRPRFEAGRFDPARDRAVNGVEDLLSTSESLSRAALEGLIFRGHPYGRPPGGTKTSLASLTPGDAADFHRRTYTRDGVEAAVSGGLVARVSQAMAVLAPGAPEPVALPPVPADPRPRVLLIRQDVPTTAVALGFAVDYTRADADYYALLAANSWLGQHRNMHGILFRGLREVRGLNYGNYSYLEKFQEGRQDKMPAPRLPRRAQHFSIWIRNLADENAVFATRYALWQLDRLVSEGLPARELAENRSFVVGNSRLWVFDPLQRLGFLLDSRFYGTGDYLEEIATRVPGVDVPALQAALKRRWAERPVRIVMVTRDVEGMKARLLGRADARPKYRTTLPADEAAVDERVLGRDLGLREEDLEIVDADDLYR